MSPRERRDESETGVDPAPQHVHYHQTKNGNGMSGATLNNVLLGCLLAIVGFLGVQLWNFNDRLARLETNVQVILQRQAPQQ